MHHWLVWAQSDIPVVVVLVSACIEAGKIARYVILEGLARAPGLLVLLYPPSVSLAAERLSVPTRRWWVRGGYMVGTWQQVLLPGKRCAGLRVSFSFLSSPRHGFLSELD